ncbi:aminoglycoside phosphotransferase family protein [Streptomyces alkaliterrae]|uniref:aminoglycoside phosphotransferase family protein n=1 Tax=Streptomyces alkaliterrae TaxID=2213162 RepID=UPI001E59A567|nr:aminoglycoside phosphotransferase family protein [Streptomyces alkaliterrae]
MTSALRIIGGFDEIEMHLKSDPVVVKIARHGSPASDVTRTVRFVRWLMSQGFPTAPLHLVDAEQPIVVDGHAVTFWTYVPQPELPVSAELLARPLNALHNLDEPPVRLTRHDNAAAIRASIARIGDLPGSLTAFPTARVDELAAELKEVSFSTRRPWCRVTPSTATPFTTTGQPSCATGTRFPGGDVSGT